MRADAMAAKGGGVMTLTPQEWGERRRGLLAQLRGEIEPIAQAAPLDLAAYRAASSPTLAQLSQLVGTSEHYLARNMTVARKMEVCAFHYEWLIDNVAPPTLIAMMERRVQLWSKEAEGTTYAVRLGVERRAAHQGELTLRLYGDNPLPLCALSFTVIPGSLIGLSAGPALLISRMQGIKDRFEELRQATRALSDVAPRAAAFAALTGLARVNGINHVAGVAARNHITHNLELHDELTRQYDQFFETLSAEGPQDGFFLLDLRAPPKPLSEVKAGHRIRTRRKRALKEEIATAAARAWRLRVAMPLPNETR